ASLQEKVLVIIALKEQLNKLKGKAVITEAVSLKPIDHELLKVVQIVLWYLDSSCSKHMTGDRSQLVNFVQKLLGTVKFGNDHVAKIMGYGDYQIGNVTISQVYYVEGLGHNLFFIGQLCHSDLEVAFRQHTCFIHNLNGVDLLTNSRGNNLYTLSLQDMMASSLICLLSKASKTKSWLWHRRVNGKKYIIVIVDDYSLFTWVKFLRSKDETLDFIIKFLKMIQSSSGPAVNKMTPGTISSGLVQKYSPSTSYVPPSQNDWDLLFQLMFDELPNPPPSVVNQASELIAPIAKVIPPVHVDSTGLPSSTTVDQDAPSSTYMGNDLLFGVPIPKVTSTHSSSTASPQSVTYKEALTQSCWIEAMHEELNEFERLEVWELVPQPDQVMVITLK
nr:integrase, catalytic region, zinc finger, CCHC-type, peptidase aspartic, catalytic [Tanacetum cinerariifolium]GFA62527.1 integrase, catalytic region, zinc finger, CCHC-type, peptidase aspartic, catalytic [Tanacetum cinerariifolium]